MKTFDDWLLRFLDRPLNVVGAVVGVVSAPALGRRWWAARGLGSFANGRPCQVSDIADLADAHLLDRQPLPGCLSEQLPD